VTSFASATRQVASHGIRGLVRTKTVWGALLVGAFAVVIAIVLAASNDGGPSSFVGFTLVLLAGIVSPLVSLLMGTWALGAEREGGTLVFTYTRPVRRSAVLLGRAIAAAAAALATMLVVTVLCAVVMQGADATLGTTLLGLLLETLAFTCVFAMLGTLMARAIYVGLAYATLVEGVLGGVINLQGGATLSQHARNIVVRGSGFSAFSQFELAQDSSASVLVLLAVSAAALVLAAVWIEKRETSGRDRVKGE